jgi:hypothetical protein
MYDLLLLQLNKKILLLYNARKIQANFYNPTSMRIHLLVLSPMHTGTYMMTPLLLFVITAFRYKLSARRGREEGRQE